MTMDSLPLPGPRAHLAGTLALVRCFARLSGGHTDAPALLDFLDRPAALPARVADRDNALKYDAYLAHGPDGPAWGVTVNDRYEGCAMHDAAAAFAAALPHAYRFDAVASFRAALDDAALVETLAVGFDHPDRPPRLKLYLQEDRWGAGVCTAATLRQVAADIAPACRVPEWLPDHRRIGVVTVEVLPGGAVGLKAYVGGPDPHAAAAGAPSSAQDLAHQMRKRSRMAGGYYYLTIRARPGQDNRYAMNRIYDHRALGFRARGRHLREGWLDVGRQLKAAGRRSAFEQLLRAIGALRGLRVVPTATAVEAGGRSADVYCGAWQMAATD